MPVRVLCGSLIEPSTVKELQSLIKEHGLTVQEISDPNGTLTLVGVEVKLNPGYEFTDFGCPNWTNIHDIKNLLRTYEDRVRQKWCEIPEDVRKKIATDLVSVHFVRD
jgi:hypothetical protein